MRKTLLGLLLCIGMTSFGQGGVLVDPMKVEFTLNKGGTAVRNIRLTNTLDQTMQFKAYLGDWIRDSMGGHKYMDPNTNSFSCARWISLDQEFIELGPKQSKTIAVKINVPDSANAVEAMKWAMLFLENTKENKLEQKSQGVTTAFNEVFRVGVHIYQTPPQANNKEVRMLSFEAAADSIYQVTCRNEGNVQASCTSFVELISLADGSKKRVDPIEFPMFPGQTRVVQFKVPANLPKGKYTIIGAVDAGEDVPLEAAQKTIEIK